MSKLTSLGIKKVVPTAPASLFGKRRLAAPASFPKGAGLRTHLKEDDRLLSISLVAGSAAVAPLQTGGSALQARMRNNTKDVVTLTEQAGIIIQEIIKAKEGTIGLTVGVQRKGCNGLAYTIDYLYPEDLEDSTGTNLGAKPSLSTTQHGVTVRIKPDAFMHVVGTVMDYHTDKSSEKFVFLNPNAEGSCGCGESFVTKQTATPTATQA